MSEHAADAERTRGYERASEQPGTLISERYKLLEEIGEGGMGTVWVAEQIQPVRRKVAVKLIKAGMDSKSVLARFEAERQALALMDHPNIARVLDGGLTEKCRPFFVMEYVKGVPITEYCDAVRLSVPARLRLFAEVCQAVQHAHQKGVIHRDLKPSNILVAPYDDRPVPKIIDFGLAKAMHQSLTEHTLHTGHGTVLGTPVYMSPEQAQLNNLDVDTRSDIYSLGVLLYELLTGTTPLEKQRYKQAAWDEVRRIIREEEPPRPSTRLSSANTLASLAACRQTEPAGLTKLVRGELDWIAMKALEKERSRRYETANGLALDVQRYLAGEAVMAVPPSAAYRLRKLARRNRGLLTAAAVIAGLLIAGIVGTTVGLIQARAAEQQALTARAAEMERAEGEKRAREQAQKRLNQIEKGSEILTSIFADLDLREVKEGTEPLEAVLAKRLLAAAAQIKEDAIGDPLVVAVLQDRLGQSLRTLGYADDAISLFLKARETRSANLGPAHVDTLTSERNLALAYKDAGKLDLALPLLQENLRVSKATLGERHRDYLHSMGALGTGYLTIGKTDLALPLLIENEKLTKDMFGIKDQGTLVSVNNLAMGHLQAGRTDRAIALLEEALKLMQVHLGRDHSSTLMIMNNLANCYRGAGQTDLALPLYEQAWSLQQSRLGATHPSTLISMTNLAWTYHHAGKLKQAVPLHEEALELMKSRLGPTHPITLRGMNRLGMAYRDVGKPDAALMQLEAAAKGMENLHFKHQYARGIVSNLIDCHEGHKQWSQAESWRRKLLAVKDRPETSPVTRASDLAALGFNLLQQQKSIEAESVLRDSLALWAKQSEDWRTFYTKSLLGDALMRQGKHEGAEALLLSGYEGMKERESKMTAAIRNDRLSQALERLVRLYEATARKDEADRWRKELDSVKRKPAASQ